MIARILLPALVLLGSFSCSRGCGIDWEVPQNHFDGVNEWGYLSYWRDVGTVDLGNNLKIPLVIGFNSTRGKSPYVGQGWILALLESSMVQVSETRFLLTQPDGIVREFWRGNGTDTVLNGQGDWKAEIAGDTITAWASCGWKLTFDHGKITSISTPEGRELQYAYNNNGLVQEVDASGSPALLTEWNSDGTLSGLSFNGKTVSFEQKQKPEVEVIEGQNLVGRMENSLHKVIEPDGVTQVYDFKVDDQLEPVLKVSGDANRSFTWDPATKKALKDGDWTYNIKQAKDPYDNAQVGRTDKDKKSEFWFKDILNGVETTVDLDGTKTIVTKFTSGLLNGRVREVQTFKNNSLISLDKNDYDENGKIIRELYSNPKDGSLDRTVSYQYLDNGGCKITISEDRLNRSRTFDSNGLVVSESETALP
jgi:YD repeat-containing protein